MAREHAHMPSDVSPRVGFFDRFAGAATGFVSRAWFFTFCVLLILLWASSYFLIQKLDTWQLIINTATTIITFLMVALLQNSQSRTDTAVHDKLNAIAAAMAELMAVQEANDGLKDEVRELRQAVGIEERESS
jgi:low affinity Fe/Cu permease